MRACLDLRLPRDPTTVAVARTVCRSTLAHLGVTGECAADIALAVTEACANAVEHAGGGHSYELRIDVQGVWLHLEVVDEGIGFDAASATPELPQQWSERGRGLGLMRHLVDELVVTSRPGAGTRVLLCKELQVEAWSPLLMGDRELESA